ncbi:MAG: DUF1775 domain-containing protein [Archangiaceae bacterium]|nr:DUF1775 domain-containing protein [Archangiaceae bacterium]
MRERSLAVAAVLLLAAVAQAHIEIASGPAQANATNEVVLSVGHGTDNADTSSVRVQIPTGVTSVRPMRSDFARPAIEVDGAGLTTAVSWQKKDEDLLATDFGFYKLTVRLKTPNAPFTTVYLPATQVVKHLDGGTATVAWVGTTAADTDAGVEPAPALRLVPAHKPGWNKLAVPVAVTDLAGYLGDAQIVWRDNAAYSSNPTTADQIAHTAGVTPLTALAAGDTIWVKY